MRRVAATSLAVFALAGGGVRAQEPGSTEQVATVGGAPITAAELEALASARLQALRTQEYQIKRAALEEAIARRLLETEAASRGISSDELQRLEVEDKVPVVTDAEAKQFYDKNKDRFAKATEPEAIAQIKTGLRGQRMRERRQELVKTLRARTEVVILLQPPRLLVGADDDPAKGPANAPVTIVEFSDFQCPYCARVVATLKKVQETYGDRVRIVFRDLPLVNIHPQAAQAAEAGSCANEQGRFWEMHDRLFANQGRLATADLKQHATDLGLDAAAFEACLASGRFTAEWKKDADEAMRNGIGSTPAFLINGRLFSGAQPYEAFVKVIDEELELARQPAQRPSGSR